MVEFALIGPLLFLMIFIIAETALYVNAVATIDNATRDGARIAALCGSNIGPVKYYGAPSTSCSGAVGAAVNANLGILPIAANNPQCCYSGGASAGSVMVVTVRYEYSWYLQYFLGQSAPSTTIQATAPVVSQQ
jgi:hypothetical protein